MSLITFGPASLA